MNYFKKILILFLSLQSVGSNLSMSYNIELIIFENKNVETKEIFEKEFKIEVDEVLKFREVDLFYNKNSFNIKNKESFFTKLFADLNINRDVLNKESVDKKTSNHLEIDQWTATTKQKVATVMIRMLKEVGILRDAKIMALDASDAYWHNFVKIGEPWFLQACLLNKERRDQISHE